MLKSCSESTAKSSADQHITHKYCAEQQLDYLPRGTMSKTTCNELN